MDKIFVKGKVWNVDHYTIEKEAEFADYTDEAGFICSKVVTASRVILNVHIEYDCCTKKLFKWLGKKAEKDKNIRVTALMSEDPRSTFSIFGEVVMSDFGFSIVSENPDDITITSDINWNCAENKQYI